MKSKRETMLINKITMPEKNFLPHIIKQTKKETFYKLRQKLTIELFDQLHDELIFNIKTHLKN
jgi:hypothetical protein